MHQLLQLLANSCACSCHSNHSLPYPDDIDVHHELWFLQICSVGILVFPGDQVSHHTQHCLSLQEVTVARLELDAILHTHTRTHTQTYIYTHCFLSQFVLGPKLEEIENDSCCFFVCNSCKTSCIEARDRICHFTHSRNEQSSSS